MEKVHVVNMFRISLMFDSKFMLVVETLDKTQSMRFGKTGLKETSHISGAHVCASAFYMFKNFFVLYIVIIIIIIYCNWVVTQWQWLFYMYTKHEIGY